MEPRISNSSLQKGLVGLVDMPSFCSKWKEIAGVDLALSLVPAKDIRRHGIIA